MWSAKELFTSLLLLSLVFRNSVSTDTVTPNQTIKDGDILVSTNKTFALGFFSPPNSSHRFVGIWYYPLPDTERTVVWVANRDNPLNDTSGVLSINGQGNLVLNCKNGSIPFWSTNASVSSMNNSMARLLDSGNLVLVGQDSQSVKWQSFDYPSNTMIPLMKLGLDRRTGFNWYLTSWKSAETPEPGTARMRLTQEGTHRCSHTRVGLRFGGPDPGPDKDGADEITVTYSVSDPNIITRLVLDESGVIRRSTWHGSTWLEFRSDPKEYCDYYRQCGPNSYCDPNNPDMFECTCFPGFEPKSTRDWYLRDGSGGCVRKKGVSTCRSGEGFVKFANVKTPDTSIARVDMSLSLKECEKECLTNCSCTAYTSADETKGGFGCLAWYGDLVDTRADSNAGQDLYVRVDAAVVAQYAKKHSPIRKKGILAVLTVSVAVLLLLGASTVYWLVMKKKKGKRQSKYAFNVDSSSTYFEESTSRQELDGSTGNSDLPFFDISTIAAATDHFSVANKLGEGGFGSVYKGVVSSGKEIAIKRLSKHSRQGIEEFKNEVAIIAKLQHRNLVRILGYCVQGEEKMLIYEYLPNKSLDSFIFNERKRSLLDWQKRLEIVCGVARGILYLHQDSRLRIIHRDLKASNVLLDDIMNPKISDFGMAKIFGSDQSEANTNRVVGTYGYMSPEYAMQGLFSVKSDVYSFGVLLLEIITGKKNSTFYHDGPSSTLIGHVWDLWSEGAAMEIVDSSLQGEKCPANEVSRCIQIGLLCVQEHATDRPTMSAVVFMLGNDTPLPYPKQPAFILKSTYNSKDASAREGAFSTNEITVSLIHGR
ncbi:G-type lectin S-receptor-like serine/threonine-protein kinase RKS1 [Morella rubra]|uniref:Receptor-like serine/threonine-protein kinase n=1 Tax=Morella rubra TaxID=262757 RepID=A0A6A1UH99_9ROSI|nr:G-type lectin S-receptor-like serine/threonine-protein kinase RKS1 [Morella rubra]